MPQSKTKMVNRNIKYATANNKGVVTTKKARKGKIVIIIANAADGTNKKAKVKMTIK